MTGAYPKIFALGHREIVTIFDDPVEITEKLDGSQFGFGRIENEIVLRSKSRIIHDPDDADKLFKPAIDYVFRIKDRLPNNVFYYGETLATPKHNTLAYDSVPRNHIALFGMRLPGDDFEPDREVLAHDANRLDVDIVPLLYYGMANPDDIPGLLKKTSYLGGTTIEGVVVKNYQKSYMLGGQYVPLSAGKYVSEAFKERNDQSWKKRKNKSKWLDYCDSFRTEARWFKAVQHLKEARMLEGDPRDIGNLLKEINTDIIDEEKEEILDTLWALFGKDIFRAATRGFPEWYKALLLEGGSQ